MVKVKKRNGNLVPLDLEKIKKEIIAAFKSCGMTYDEKVINNIVENVKIWDEITVEEIQDQIEEVLMDFDYPQVAKEYILYRAKHSEIRFIKEKFLPFKKRIKNDKNLTPAEGTEWRRAG